MNPKVIFSVCFVLTIVTLCNGRATTKEPVGKYQVSKSNQDDGKYRPVKRNEGRYIHMVQPYVHTHDNRELGKYQHVAIPYNGGYGPYSGLLNPYRHDDTGSYDKYTTTSTTTRRPTTTTTTTTMKPRIFNYHEEGGWRIIRQEEEKKKHKYDFLYLTENGIYGEEKAHLRKDAGTAASGYYEYTGDDGELYRVNYKSDERGFIPEADHIPTPPPVPDAIKRALEYVAKKKEIHGRVQTGQYEHKPGPVKLQNMPTIDRPAAAVPVRPLAPPTIPPQPRYVQYNAANQYSPLPTGLGSVASQQDQPKTQYVSQNIAPYESPLQPQPSEPVPTDGTQPEQLQANQPQADQPQADQPQADQPQADEPQADQPQADQPQADQPQADQPQADQPQADEPQADQPQADQPQADQPQADQPQADEPQADQPQADQPQADQPQADQPQADQPLADQPQYDQPQADQPQADQPQADQPQDQLPQDQAQLEQQQGEQLQADQPQQDQSAEELSQEDQPANAAEPVPDYVEQVPQASEQFYEFQPPYQVPEELRDEKNYEYATA